MYNQSPAAASLSASLSEPESTGWLGELSLDFSVRDGRMLLSHRRPRGPFTVQRRFYHEDRLPHVYLLHPPGGVVGGDRLYLNVTLAAGSRALLTMPGATKFYRSACAPALRQRFSLGADSVLEWLPQGNIFFPGARVRMQTDFTLAPGAQLIGFETLCFGRPVMEERFSKGELDTHLRITLPAAAWLMERLRVTRPELGKIGGYPPCTTFFSPHRRMRRCSRKRWRSLRRQGSKRLGTRLLETLLVVSALEEDNQRLQGMLHRMWSALRPGIMGRDAVAPRIWST